jgi:hypothetical protein
VIVTRAIPILQRFCSGLVVAGPRRGPGHRHHAGGACADDNARGGMPTLRRCHGGACPTREAADRSSRSGPRHGGFDSTSRRSAASTPPMRGVHPAAPTGKWVPQGTSANSDTARIAGDHTGGRARQSRLYEAVRPIATRSYWSILPPEDPHHTKPCHPRHGRLDPRPRQLASPRKAPPRVSETPSADVTRGPSVHGGERCQLQGGRGQILRQG